MNNAPPPGTAPMQLTEMSTRRDYRVCKDSYDPRGWLVRTADDRELGKISDLIIDEVGLNVRYLVCAYAIGGRRVLLPVGFARLDPRARVVHLDFITRTDIQRLPDYKGLPISAEQTQHLESALTLRDPPARESVIVRRDSITADELSSTSH
jgi:hypothetical protein